MDEIVIRSMLRWPDVPAVYGWLALGRRGNWLIKTLAKDDISDPAAAFERISNPAMIDFIGRNYARDDWFRYFFQNGPQRVYVTLDYTPYVFRLDDEGTGFLAQTGARAGRVKRAFFDQNGSLILVSGLGVGLLLDRDLGATLERLTDRAGRQVDPEWLYEHVRSGRRFAALLMGDAIAVSSVAEEDVQDRFGFVSRPEPTAA